MNIKQLLEEFLMGFKTSYRPKEYVEVFKNPTSKEMNDSINIGEVRYIASPREILYVFKPIVTHFPAAEEINKKDKKTIKEFWDGKALGGIAKKKGKWFVTTDIHNVGVDGNDIKEWSNKNASKWKWLEKYNIGFPK